MLEKGGEVVYQVEYKERLTTFTPIEVAAFIYRKMMGKLHAFIINIVPSVVLKFLESKLRSTSVQ